MKKLITTLTLGIVATTGFSQSQNWWRSNGNTPASTDVLGTTNAQPLNIVTNNVLKMVLDANGNLRLVNFAGSGNRIVTTDANGNLLALPQGTTGQFLSSNGTWQNLPAVPTQLWSTSGNSIYYPTGNVGIGAVPNTAYRLDVAGDARVQNNLYVGGGILISQKVEATNSLKTDTVRSASGSTKFANNVVLKQQFQVDGNSIFNGALQAGVLNAGSLNVSGNTVFTNTLIANQGIGLGNNTMFKSSISQTPGVGKIFTLDPLIGTPIVNPPPCVVGGTSSWLNNSTNGLYSSQSSVGQTWFTQYVDNTDGNSYIDASGSANGLTQAELILNQKCSSNTRINWAGGIAFLGNTNCKDFLTVGTGNSIATSGFINVLNSQGDAVKVTVPNTAVSNNVNAFIIDGNGAGTTFRVRGSGVTQIGSNSGVAAYLNVKGELNTTTNCFETDHNADYGYNTKIVVNRDFTKAYAVFNSASGSPVESFKVYGNGITEINSNIPLLSGNALFLVKNTNLPTTQTWSQNVFEVKPDGKTYIGQQRQNTGTHTNAVLNVYGKTVSTEVIVTQVNWADFVFDKKYNLMPLSDLETYYKTNHHLPNVPSTKEITTDGNDLGKTDAILLQKIEELTLYIVELQKQVNELKKTK